MLHPEAMDLPSGEARSNDDGVDRVQILDMLDRTPEERLEAMRAFVAGLSLLVDASATA